MPAGWGPGLAPVPHSGTPRGSAPRGGHPCVHLEGGCGLSSQFTTRGHSGRSGSLVNPYVPGQSFSEVPTQITSGRSGTRGRHRSPAPGPAPGTPPPARRPRYSRPRRDVHSMPALLVRRGRNVLLEAGATHTTAPALLSAFLPQAPRGPSAPLSPGLGTARARHGCPWRARARGCWDQRMPSWAVQEGQAPQPCEAWVFLAMSICWARVAWSAVGAYLPPPKACQVWRENCSPPW